jgi:hypothetical protein
MNRQAKDRLSQLLARTPENRRPKAKVEAKDKEEAPDTKTKSCLTGRKQEHLPGNCIKKRERFPTTVVEYQENEVRDLTSRKSLISGAPLYIFCGSWVVHHDTSPMYP